MKDKPQIKENNSQISVHFESLLELMDYVPFEINSRRFLEYMGRQSYDTYGGNKNWYGATNHNAKDTLNHALIGDEVLYNSLKNKIGLLDREVGTYTKDYQQQIQMSRRKKFKSDFGDEMDIHKVYQGQCNIAWTKTKRVEVNQVKHLVTILVDYVGNCDESVDDTLWRAAVAVKLVDDLTKAGKSVKLVCGSVSSNSMVGISKLLSTSVVIKKFNERLSLSRLSAMTHLGFFRSAGFAMLCAQNNKMTVGLGHACDLSYSNMPIHLKEEVDAGHVKFINIGRISSLRQATKGLENAYKQMKSFS